MNSKFLDFSDARTTTELFKDWVEKRGSLTPCNQNLISNVDYGPVIDSESKECEGFRTKGSVPLSDIFHHLEDMEFSELPEHIREPLSGLMDEDDWSAALRFVTLLFDSFEREKK